MCLSAKCVYVYRDDLPKHLGKIRFPRMQYVHFWSVGTLRNYDGDGNRNVKKAKGLMSKTTILHVHHAFLYTSLPSLLN